MNVPFFMLKILLCNPWNLIKLPVPDFYIDTFNKVDIKMNIPEVLIVMSFPMKMKEFFDGLLFFFNN